MLNIGETRLEAIMSNFSFENRQFVTTVKAEVWHNLA